MHFVDLLLFCFYFFYGGGGGCYDGGLDLCFRVKSKLILQNCKVVLKSTLKLY